MENYKKENKKFFKTYNIEECFKTHNDELLNLESNLKTLRTYLNILNEQFDELREEVKAKTKIVLKESDYKKIIKILENDRRAN